LAGTQRSEVAALGSVLAYAPLWILPREWWLQRRWFRFEA
jgi:hypothetical protein